MRLGVCHFLQQLLAQCLDQIYRQLIILGGEGEKFSQGSKLFI